MNNKILNSKSYVLFVCSGPASIFLNKNNKEIMLDEGVNILTVEDHPDLAYGFSTEDKSEGDGFSFTCYPNFRMIDLSHFDSSKVSDMSYMFGGMNELRYVNLEGLDTSNVEDMEGMFIYCEHLRDINLSSFDTSKVKYLTYMFLNCQSLVSLDLSHFDVRNVEYFGDIFNYTSGMVNISNWKIGRFMGRNEHAAWDECKIHTLICKNCDDFTIEFVADILTSK